jgi:hypothetical protein
MRSPTRLVLLLLVLGVTLPGLTGCRGLGARSVPRDRFDYSAALADSWKSMMLLNIVKARYLDLPVFLDVGQVVSSYTLETSGSVGGTLNSVGAPSAPGNSLVLGGSARYSQQPTITYTPLTGNKFLEGFLNPIEPEKVFALVQSGYAADFVFQLGVESLNGLRNQPVTLGSKYQADPEFFRVLTLLREIQDARAVGLRVERPTNGQPARACASPGPAISRTSAVFATSFTTSSMSCRPSSNAPASARQRKLTASSRPPWKG